MLSDKVTGDLKKLVVKHMLPLPTKIYEQLVGAAVVWPEVNTFENRLVEVKEKEIRKD